MSQKEEQVSHRQYLIDTILNYLGEHYDSSRLYEMFHDEMGFSDEDIVELGFELSEYRSYEWKDGDVRRQYAEQLDDVLPRRRGSSLLKNWATGRTKNFRKKLSC